RGHSVVGGTDEPVGLFVVADGMGGHAAGEVASEMAVQTLERELSGVNDLSDTASAERVTEALRMANRTIHERTITEVDKQGMGTTASVLVLSASRYLIGQVGGSWRQSTIKPARFSWRRKFSMFFGMRSAGCTPCFNAKFSE